jgi:hypothetical protein
MNMRCGNFKPFNLVHEKIIPPVQYCSYLISMVMYFLFEDKKSDEKYLPSISIALIDIESLQSRLLKVCYVPATSAGLPRLLFLQQPLTILKKQTRQAVRAVKQST